MAKKVTVYILVFTQYKLDTATSLNFYEEVEYSFSDLDAFAGSSQNA